MELINEGLIWRIGDGVRLDVKYKNWIYRDSSFKPLMLNNITDVNTAIFINPDRTWNIPLINCCFHQLDVNDIISIPLSRVWREDCLY